MPFCDVYIGRLDDPDFSWEGGDWNGNVPHRVSPFFPPTGGPRYGAWSEFQRRLSEGLFKGRQTDWGGWVVPASKSEIEVFVDDLYPEHGSYHSSSPHLADQVSALRQFVANIEDDGQFAIVATEL